MKTEAAQAAPPISVAGLTLWGVQLSDWILILTLIWSLFLIIDKVPVVYERLSQFAQWVKEKFNVQGK